MGSTKLIPDPLGSGTSSKHNGSGINFWEGPARKHAPGHKLQALKEQATS